MKGISNVESLVSRLRGNDGSQRGIGEDSKFFYLPSVTDVYNEPRVFRSGVFLFNA